MPTTLLGRRGESSRTSAAANRWPVKEIWPKGWPSIWATWPSPSRTPKDMPAGWAKRTLRPAQGYRGRGGRKAGRGRARPSAGYGRRMASRITEFCLDCRDPAGLAAWWAEVLGYEVVGTEDDGSVEIGPPGQEPKGVVP